MAAGLGFSCSHHIILNTLILEFFLFHGLVSERKDSGLYRLFPNNLAYIISLPHLLTH